MANVNVAVTELNPLGGITNSGLKVGLISSVAKAAQNDTVTVTNALSVEVLSATHIATGAFETHTVSNNVITLTSATTGAKKILVAYK